MQIVITYPPDFDGELHITAERNKSTKSTCKIRFEFTVACKDTDSERDVLYQTCQHIVERMSRARLGV